jgi:transposase
MDAFANVDTTVDRNTPYIRRRWITLALNLRFSDGLTYRDIAEQLSISSSATHKMFMRFRRTGISWPLPEDYTPERLEEELYAFNLETNLPVKNRRPDWPLEFKIRNAELSLQPDACVVQLAREHGVNDNLVFNWRNLHLQGLLDPAVRAGMIPVTVESFAVPVRQNGGTPDSPPVISCKLTLPGGSLSLTGPVTPELLRALVSELREGEA